MKVNIAPIPELVPLEAEKSYITKLGFPETGTVSIPVIGTMTTTVDTGSDQVGGTITVTIDTTPTIATIDNISLSDSQATISYYSGTATSMGLINQDIYDSLKMLRDEKKKALESLQEEIEKQLNPDNYSDSSSKLEAFKNKRNGVEFLEKKYWESPEYQGEFGWCRFLRNGKPWKVWRDDIPNLIASGEMTEEERSAMITSERYNKIKDLLKKE